MHEGMIQLWKVGNAMATNQLVYRVRGQTDRHTHTHTHTNTEKIKDSSAHCLQKTHQHTVYKTLISTLYKTHQHTVYKRLISTLFTKLISTLFTKDSPAHCLQKTHQHTVYKRLTSTLFTKDSPAHCLQKTHQHTVYKRGIRPTTMPSQVTTQGFEPTRIKPHNFTELDWRLNRERGPTSSKKKTGSQLPKSINIGNFWQFLNDLQYNTHLLILDISKGPNFFRCFRRKYSEKKTS
jgi:hypothetical protein